MAEQVQLPALGESVTEGIITQWLVEVGDTVEVDQPIVEISTDKVDTEIPSPVAGTVQELRGDVDDEIAVGDVIAVIGDSEGADGGGSGGDDGGDAGEDAGEDDEQVEADTSDDADSETANAQATPTEDEGGRADDDSQAGTSYAGGEAELAEAGSKPSTSKVSKGEDHTHDVIVLGGGTGGYSVALRAAQLGLEVALVEKEKVGGTCLHWGCIPAKAILQTAEVAEYAQDAAGYGVKASYEGIEVAALNEHKANVVEKMWKGLQGALKGRGVETVAGTGTLTAKDTVVVETEDGERELKAPAVVIATGSKPRGLPFAEFDGKRVISSDEALYLDKLPKRAIILGSGAVGMEFATAWSAFGVETTIIELEDRLLPLEDADSSKEIGRQFRKRENLTAMTGAKVTDVKTTQRTVTATVETGKGETEEVKADLLLIAIGRKPVVEGLGYEEVGIELDRGFVKVDEYARTSVEGIWAVGDIIPTLGLAHASFAEGFLVADQLGGLDVVPIDYKGVPRVTYSHPEVSSVGYTEAEAKEAGFEVVTEKYPFQALARAAMMNATGMVKVIAEKDDSAEGGAGRVLGIHVVGPRATDLIGEAELIYNWEALSSDVAHFVHAHPTLNEAIGEAHLALAGRALHG